MRALAPGAAIVGLLLSVTACGSGDAGRPQAAASSPSAARPTTSTAPTAGGSGVVQLRQVAKTSTDHVAAIGHWPGITEQDLAQFRAYRCDQSSPPSTPAARSEIACDDAGTAYLMLPAAWSGHVTAVAKQADAALGTWMVDVTIPGAGKSALFALTNKLRVGSGTRYAGGRIALVTDGMVLVAPGAGSAIPNGELEITGAYTEKSARALAAKLDPRG